MKRVGIIAALPGELAPLVRGWVKQGQVYKGRLTPLTGGQPTIDAYAVCAGIGSAAATRSFSLLTAAAEANGHSLDAVVSIGWAGAISCGVKPPQVHSIAEVIDTRTGERFPTCNPPAATPLRLVTLDHVARSNEKRPLAERYKAVLVDMEAATVGRLARAHHLDFYCVKAISDGYTDVLPDFNYFLDREGQLQLPALVAHALLRPAYWAALARLGANSRAAARNLALALPSCLEPAGLIS